MTSLVIRRASAEDAPGIAALMRVIAAERVYSAINKAWSVEERRATSNPFPPAARCT